MNTRAMSAVVWATMVAAPTVVAAQAVPLPPANAPACDCPLGDSRGDLRNLAAFAPLGLLGALAAAGGVPALYAGGDTPAPPPTIAGDTPKPPADPELPTVETGRNLTPPPPTGGAPVAPEIPEPVSPDSLRGGIRAPNTGTPLPSVLVLGVSLVAVGSVVLRHRG